MKRKILYLLIISIFSTQCKKKNEETVRPDHSSDLNQYLQRLEDPFQPSVNFGEKQIGDSIIEKNSSETCITKKVALGAGYEEGFLLDPQSDVIYPGSIIDGNSVVDGRYQPITLPRSGGELSVSLQNIKNVSAKVSEVKLSTVRNALMDILSDKITGTSQANINFSIHEIYSEKQLEVVVGASVGKKGLGEIKGKFNFTSTGKRTKLLVKFQQIYYTADFDAPTQPSKFFTEEVTKEMVKKSLSGDITPVYVSSVKYGRLAFYSFESNEESKKVMASLNVALEKAKVKAELEATFKSDQVLKDITVSGTIIGGSGSDAVKAIHGQQEFYEYITKGGDYSPTSPGAPIAYTLRKVSDNNTFRVVKSTEYTVRNCYKVAGDIKAKYFYGVSGDNNVYGTLYVAYGYEGEGEKGSQIIWNASRDHAVAVPQGGKTQEILHDGASFIFNPEKLDKAYIEFRTSGFNDRDDGDLESDDPYHNGSFRIKLSDLKSGKIEINNDGTYYFKNISIPTNFYKEWGPCCGLCVDKCRKDKGRADGSTINIALSIKIPNL